MLKLVYVYLRWHYSQALYDQVGIARNLLWFCSEFFSLVTLVRTLFVPFHRLNEGYRKGFAPSAWLETWLLNTLMRIVGAVVRSVVILLGLGTMLCVLVGCVLTLIVWLLAPLLLLLLIVAAGIFITY